jgi:hypothetical protein
MKNNKTDRRGLKLKFIDQWPGWPGRDSFLYRLISQDYDIDDSGSPDYVLSAGNGYEHLKYDCIKILWTGENIVPDFNCFDYCMGFDHIEFDDRYARIPHFVLYKEFASLGNELKLEDTSSLLKRDFCSFVVSNGTGSPLREKFFYRLSKYKPVASGGRYLNNVGGPVPNKLEFCAKYKFNIAFENSVSPGYCTEKVMQPLTVHSVPIYYGSPTVEEDFNLNCMVLVKDESDMERAVEEIIYLDTHDDAYLEKILCPCLAQKSPEFYYRRMKLFLQHIFDQPIEKAHRLIPYGMQPNYRHQISHWIRQTAKVERIARWLKLPWQ